MKSSVVFGLNAGVVICRLCWHHICTAQRSQEQRSALPDRPCMTRLTSPTATSLWRQAGARAPTATSVPHPSSHLLTVQPAFCQRSLSLISIAQLNHEHKQVFACTALGWLVFMQRSTQKDWEFCITYTHLVVPVQVFPAILDEFGSILNSKTETSCIASIISYANGAVNPKTHAKLTSWYFWWVHSHHSVH